MEAPREGDDDLISSNASFSSFANSVTSDEEFVDDGVFLTANRSNSTHTKTNRSQEESTSTFEHAQPEGSRDGGAGSSTEDYHMPSLVNEGTARARKVYVGDDALQDFFRLYHDTEYVLQCSTRPPSARSLYLRSCVEDSVTPEPSGIIRKNNSPSIKLSGYGLGDERVSTFSSAFPLIPDVTSVDLRENRISHKKAEVILKALTSSKQLQVMDLGMHEMILKPLNPRTLKS